MAWYELPVWEYLNPIVVERNTEIMKLLLDFLKSSLYYKLFSNNISHECTVIITIGVLFHCISRVSLFLLANVIIFSSCCFIRHLTSPPEQSLSLIKSELRVMNYKSVQIMKHEANNNCLLCLYFTVACLLVFKFMNTTNFTVICC